MPLIVITLVAAVGCGLWLPRRAAFTVTGALCVVTVVAFGWAVTDGRGTDPWWLLLVALAACALALTVVHALSGRQRRLPA
jgi:uncharacterized membrane protein